MVARIQLTPAERDIIARVAREGWRVNLDNWTIGRLALARSLQIPEAPDLELYRPISSQKGGVELHAAQLTGEGRTNELDDFTDLYRSMLSLYEGIDLFSDEGAYHEALQRHVRRGLAVIAAEWQSGTDINRYIVDEIFVERTREDLSTGDKSDFDMRVTRVLGQIGVSAKLIESFDGPRLTRFTFELSMLDDLDRLKRGVSKIGFALGLGDRTVDLSLGSAERTVLLDIPRAATSWKTINWGDLQTVLLSPQAVTMALPICIGTDVLGEPLLLDLAEGPHLFVGGTTGSGKSMCLHSILLSLISHPSQSPDLLLIDPKAVEFAGYKGLKNLIEGSPIISPDDAQQALEALVVEMERRKDIFNEYGARDISEANAKGAKLKRIVAIVDELGDLFMSRDGIDIPLIKLAQKSRSAGIHLVLATQRPEAATFSGMLRSSIPSRIALTVQKGAESRIILDEGGAESLLSKGDMLVKFTGSSIIRAHGCRVLPSDISSAVR
tara:strand:+ start:7859 stop:9349 length:1491 start_codon:yes stop_codon:yes gene_type:complete